MRAPLLLAEGPAAEPKPVHGGNGPAGPCKGSMQNLTLKRAFVQYSRELICTGLAIQGLLLAPIVLDAADRPKPINQMKAVAASNSESSELRLIQFTGEKEESGGISSAFKKAGDSISGFFSSEPREPSADDDPIRLSNMPSEIGADVYLSGARMMENSGNFEGAERQYKLCLEKFPSNRLALVSYARLLHRNQRLKDALVMYQKAEKEHPKDAVVQNDLGLCLARMGQKDDAMAHFHKATTLAPEDPRYRNNLAMVLVDAGRTDEALSQLVYAHGKSAGHYNLGYLLFRKGDQQGAAQQFQAALQIDPKLKQAEDMLARIQNASQMPAAVPARGPQQSPNTMFISDQPMNRTSPVSTPNESSKIPPAPELEPPRLLPPVN